MFSFLDLVFRDYLGHPWTTFTGMRTFGLEPQARCALIMVGVLTLSLFEAGEAQNPAGVACCPKLCNCPASAFLLSILGRLWEIVDFQ